MVVCTTGGSGRRQLGGAERYLVDTLPALAAGGLDVVACTPNDAVGAALRDAGMPWFELGATRRIDPSYVREIRRVLREVRPDVVGAHLLSAAMHCRAALSVGYRDVPLVVTLHNSLWQYRQSAPSPRAKARAQFNIGLDLTMRRLRPHLTVAVSQYEAAELRTRGRVDNIRVLPNPLPRAWPQPLPRSEPAPAGRLRIGFMGRLEPEKGADLLGDIARAVPDADFTIAGSGTVTVPQMSNVELVGHVDSATFLRAVDCLVVPSRVESFGRSALEALSLGVPVVHSGVGGLAEVTRHADGVLAFATEQEPAAIGTAIRKATEPGAAPAERLAIAGWYQREFAFERSAQRWSELYRSVVRG
jgi:glycosyltransferase involved in cell wall biosynthesis